MSIIPAFQLSGRLNRSKDPRYESLACLLGGSASPLAEQVIPFPSHLNRIDSSSGTRASGAADIFGWRVATLLARRSRNAQLLEIYTV